MYRSIGYAGQRNKSVFLEIPERSAESARLLQQAREPDPEGPLRRQRLSVFRVACRWDRLLQRTGKRMPRRRAEAHG